MIRTMNVATSFKRERGKGEDFFERRKKEEVHGRLMSIITSPGEEEKKERKKGPGAVRLTPLCWACDSHSGKGRRGVRGKREGGLGARFSYRKEGGERRLSPIPQPPIKRKSGKREGGRTSLFTLLFPLRDKREE